MHIFIRCACMLARTFTKIILLDSSRKIDQKTCKICHNCWLNCCGLKLGENAYCRFHCGLLTWSTHMHIKCTFRRCILPKMSTVPPKKCALSMHMHALGVSPWCLLVALRHIHKSWKFEKFLLSFGRATAIQSWPLIHPVLAAK